MRSRPARWSNPLRGSINTHGAIAAGHEQAIRDLPSDRYEDTGVETAAGTGASRTAFGAVPVLTT